MSNSNHASVDITLGDASRSLICDPYFSEYRDGTIGSIYLSGIGFLRGTADNLRLFADQLVQAAQAAELFEAQCKKEAAA